VAQDELAGEVTTSINDLAVFKILLSGAICELLEENGFVTSTEVLECVKRLESETKIDLHHLLQCRCIGEALAGRLTKN
jgi:hypothetical protein